MNLNDVNPQALRELWSRCSPTVGGSPCLEDGASALVSALHERFEESIVLTRMFVTIPYASLPGRQKEFATELARKNGLIDQLKEKTPVLTLLATWGARDEWKSPRTSRGHIAIPLVSEVFVSSIPMVSRLLKEMGLPLTWLQDAGGDLARESFGSEVGLFYVEDAPKSVDDQGRKIIAAQDFVAEHNVHSVFAVGGAYFGGSVMAMILFCRQPVEQRAARSFMPLVNLFKGSTSSRFSVSRIFRPETGDDAAQGSAKAA